MKKGSQNHLAEANASEEFINVVDNLLIINDSDRVGSKLREHPWFEEINWEELRNRKTTAPHKPSLVGLKPTKEGEERKYADYTGDDHMFDGF